MRLPLLPSSVTQCPYYSPIVSASIPYLAGTDVTDSDCISMIRKVDANGNGVVDFREFEDIFRAQAKATPKFFYG